MRRSSRNRGLRGDGPGKSYASAGRGAADRRQGGYHGRPVDGPSQHTAQALAAHFRTGRAGVAIDIHNR